ncbi:MAG TPA: aminotransferase class I/II-fold pyridoxal phosphate-dependent enzyme [Sphaerochaeta sp.]|nr:aminotransferase class I/II-fold pyridoxal phosphate-dependent enzyme [Sphaerochaeta sp.]HQB55051.1 aminotransferase class I/II-fold pyridoxal phosphate-dependent enzyme [Sphaerochaeta sp.]
MYELARELNQTLEDSVVGSLLSETGRRMFFPKGIVAQSAEATEKAKRFNATAGLATLGGQAMHLRDIFDRFVPGSFVPNDIFSYSPGGGDMRLRKLWLKEMIAKNPTLKDKKISLPLVTAGLTNGLAMIASLFVDPGDTFVLPDLNWDNYELIYHHQYRADVKKFPSFTEEGHFNVAGLLKLLESTGTKKAHLLLNFPSNPAGYSLTEREQDELVEGLVALAEKGMVLNVIADDAYFGLFYEDDIAKESIFAKLCDAHERIFAIKSDGATKETMVWGFRIGFITYGAKGLTDQQHDALNKKTLGAIRTSVSNCDRPGQSLLIKAMQEGRRYEIDKQAVFSEMKRRYLVLKETLKRFEGDENLIPYPFNSGYFVAFKTRKSAEELRRHLLDRYEVGTINIDNTTLRVAYCSVDLEKIGELVELIYQAAGEIWN